MTEIVERVHFIDKQTLFRSPTLVMLVLICSGVAACFVGALTYDVGRLFSAW
jgi:hypothetical protein